MLLAWLLLQTAEPRISVTVTEKEVEVRDAKKPGFHCEGAARLPDGARITLWLYWERVELGMQLVSRTALVKEGRFESDLVFFDARTFPGPYIIRATLNSVNQPPEVFAALEEGERPEAQAELRVGTPEEEARARRAVLDDLEAVLAHFESVGRQIVEAEAPKDEASWAERIKGWTTSVAEKTDAFGARKEIRLLGLGDIIHDAFEPMTQRVPRLAQIRRKDAAEAAAELEKIRTWTDKLRARYLRGETTQASQRAAALIDVIEKKLDADPSAELLELGGLMPPEAAATLQALAEAVHARRTADALEQLRLLRRWITP